MLTPLIEKSSDAIEIDTNRKQRIREYRKDLVEFCLKQGLSSLEQTYKSEPPSRKSHL